MINNKMIWPVKIQTVLLVPHLLLSIFELLFISDFRCKQELVAAAPKQQQDDPTLDAVLHALLSFIMMTP